MDLIFEIIILLLGTLGVPTIIIVWLIWEFWITPKSARTLRKAKMKKRIPIIVEYDSGRIEIKLEKESTPEGGIKTEDGWTGFFPRLQVESSNPGQEFGAVQNLVTKKTFLADCGVPVAFAYAGKAVLSNLQTLANLTYAPDKDKDSAGKDSKVQEIEVGTKKYARVLWLVNLRILKMFFPKCWNIAQVRAMERQSEDIGFKRAQKFLKSDKGPVLLGMVIALIIVLMIFLVVLVR